MEYNIYSVNCSPLLQHQDKLLVYLYLVSKYGSNYWLLVAGKLFKNTLYHYTVEAVKTNSVSYLCLFVLCSSWIAVKGHGSFNALQ